ASRRGRRWRRRDGPARGRGRARPGPPRRSRREPRSTLEGFPDLGVLLRRPHLRLEPAGLVVGAGNVEREAVLEDRPVAVARLERGSGVAERLLEPGAVLARASHALPQG